MSMAADLKISVRPFFSGDMARAMEIETCSHANPWSLESFRFVMDRALGQVAVIDGTIVGYVVYSIDEDCICIQNIAVHPSHRRKGIGGALVRSMGKAASAARRKKIMIDVRESDLTGQRFFSANGFSGVGVIPCLFLDTLEDSFRMEWTSEDKCKGK